MVNVHSATVVTLKKGERIVSFIIPCTGQLAEIFGTSFTEYYFTPSLWELYGNTFASSHQISDIIEWWCPLVTLASPKWQKFCYWKISLLLDNGKELGRNRWTTVCPRDRRNFGPPLFSLIWWHIMKPFWSLNRHTCGFSLVYVTPWYILYTMSMIWQH